MVNLKLTNKFIKAKRTPLLLMLGVLAIFMFGQVIPLHASGDAHGSASHSNEHDQSSSHSVGGESHKGGEIHHGAGHSQGKSESHVSVESVNSILPFAVVMIPLLAVFGLMLVGEKQGLKFTAYANLLSFSVNLLMIPYIWNGKMIQFVLSTSFSGVSLAFFADDLSFIVGIISNFVWMIVSFYSIEYMSHEKNIRRYNSFSMLSLVGMLGVVYTRNLFSLYLFFETLSTCSYVMVVHEETEDAHKAGIKYISLGIAGGLVLFGSFVLTYSIAGTADLVELLMTTGKLGQSPWMPYIFLGMIFGFGIKAGMFPLHIWLPDAHPVAPAPASALLSGVMIKAGGYGILRVIYNIVGVDFMRHKVVLSVVLIFAFINIILGSAMAIRAKEIKLMLAYSSISQIGYVLLGTTVLTQVGMVGGVIHIFNHAMMKGTLFMCAGAFIHQTGFRQLEDLKGIGKKMPIITSCFTMAGMSMIGLPPFSGFVSKWFLALGSLDVVKAGSFGIWVGIFALMTLILSSFMNLLYYGPIVYNAWFQNKAGEEDMTEHTQVDPHIRMWLPILILAFGILVFGLLPHFPLHFARSFSTLAFH
jgi:multicomponent Na+:H+ antiporter subunit D